jgi:hypothetical protein
MQQVWPPGQPSTAQLVVRTHARKPPTTLHAPMHSQVPSPSQSSVPALQLVWQTALVHVPATMAIEQLVPSASATFVQPAVGSQLSAVHG